LFDVLGERWTGWVTSFQRRFVASASRQWNGGDTAQGRV
jgi:hypothetical protein